VRMVCAETHLPYDRPPLSKEVLGEAAAEDSVAYRSDAWYQDKGIELLRGVGASGLDATAHRLELADGSAVAYEQLVIATGSRPRMLPAFAPYENVSTLRTLEDSRAIRELLEARSRLLIIGAGFIGQEVAVAARGAGVEVTVIEAEQLPLRGLLGHEIGTWFAELHRGEGVELMLGHTATEIHGDGRVEAVTLDDGRRVETDHVLVGIGVVPATDWVASAGLPSGAIATDEGGRSELPDVYAAGDAAAFYDAFLGRHTPSGHWESAGRQGAAVANSIVGRRPAAAGLSSFWSDQYGVRIQYIGHAHLADSVSFEGDREERDFVAVYTRDGEAVAALIVGRPKALPEMRDRLSYITERTPA
jgi:3-phenylpropionate/trans-cinnamate dioxygenase ferredoxin reductase component